MALRARTAFALALPAVLASACQDRPAADAGAQPSSEPSALMPQNLPLKEIMQGLEEDLAELAHGLWIEDPAVVSAAAHRIAEHPRVPPEQMGAIQSALSTEFSAFVAMDQLVHDAAVALAAAADSVRPTPVLFATYMDIQEGCMSCHETFRDRVAKALAALEEPGR